MATSIKFTIWLVACSLFLPQWARGQQFFDPATDTIAFTDRYGVWEMKVPESVLTASVQAAHADLCDIGDLRIQDIHGKPYIFFRGKRCDEPGTGYTVMIQLKNIGDGAWVSGDVFQSCTGNNCSTCGFDEYWGCSCERFDGSSDGDTATYCRHMIALGMGLKKVAYPD